MSPATADTAMIEVPAIRFRLEPNVWDTLFGREVERILVPQCGVNSILARRTCQKPSFHLAPEAEPKARLVGSACPQ